MPDKDCPFCNIPDDSIVASNDLALAICDNFPVSPGHMLFIPRRHVASWFDATEEEQIAIMRLINEVSAELTSVVIAPSVEAAGKIQQAGFVPTTRSADHEEDSHEPSEGSRTVRARQKGIVEVVVDHYGPPSTPAS